MASPDGTPQSRANELLKEYLDEKQLSDYRDYSYFWVTAQSGRQYRLGVGCLVVAADLRNTYGEIPEICIIAPMRGGVPEPDRLLTLKILLETNEQSILTFAGDYTTA